MPSSDYILNRFFYNSFWPDYFFVNKYPVLAILWNVFLLVVPFFLCLLIYERYKKRSKSFSMLEKAYLILLFFLWLIFIPNSAYIITDVRHLLDYCPNSPYRICPNNAWMIMFFFIYASIGWVAFVFLLNQMKDFIGQFYKKLTRFFIPIIIPLISLGVLLGLVDRWNSWEVFTSPVNVLVAISEYVTNYIYFRNWIVFSIGLFLLYYTGDLIFTNEKISKKFKF